ncbi:tetratricopeptide repeat protein [Planctomycetota bacterium]|nr:tetratricopeptide repeat protein [Planctomycetota bacterium]
MMELRRVIAKLMAVVLVSVVGLGGGCMLVPETSTNWLEVEGWAKSRMSLGQYDEAIGYGERMLAIAKEQYDADGIEVARSYAVMGRAYIGKGDLVPGVTLLRKATGVEATRLEENRVMLMGLLVDLGRVYSEMGQYENAVDAEREGLAIGEAVYGTKDLRLTLLLNNLGFDLYLLNEDVEAEAVLKRQLELFDIYAVDDRMEVADSHFNLALLYQKLERYEEALGEYRRAVKVMGKVEEMDVIKAASYRLAFGLMSMKVGDYEGAKREIERVVKVYEQVFDNSELQLATGKAAFASVVRQMGEYEKADAIDKQVQGMYQAVMGYDKDVIADNVVARANELRELNRVVEAEFMEAYAKRIRGWTWEGVKNRF